MRIQKPCFVALGVSLAVLTITVFGHPSDDMERLRRVVATWANAVASGDAVTMKGLLHDDFRSSFGASKTAYLATLEEGTLPPGRVILRHAFYRATEEGFEVAPVVFDNPGWLGARTLKLVEVAGELLLVAITPTELPEAALPGVLPEHRKLHDVQVRLRDATTAELIAARVRVVDGEREYWPPRGHQKNIALGWREDVGGDVYIDGETFAYVEGDFVLPLPPGSYVLEARRGLEYEPATVRFAVSETEVPDVEVSLRRWIHMAAEGWYSGDTHTHFLSPATAALEGRGEDLNVVNVLAAKWGELITDVEHFTGAPSHFSGAGTIIYVNEECRHGFLGHTIFLQLEELVYPLSWGAPLEGVVGGYDYPPMAYQADRVHAQGGHVAWAHFPHPRGELAIDVALGKVDSIDLMTWGDAFAPEGFLPGSPGAADTWYRFLDCGFRLPATAGTDKMLNIQVTGSVRTYVQVDGAFSYSAWIDGVRAGRTFTTTGPMLTFTAAGHRLGDTVAVEPGQKIPVRAEVRSLAPIGWIEIVQGSEVVARKDNDDGRARLILEAEVAVTESSWIAARVSTEGRLPYQAMALLEAPGVPNQAHTSPIYLEVGGQPARSAEDAAYFVGWCDEAIRWAEDTARFHHQDQRREVIELFERARAVYRSQIEETAP